MNTHILVSIDEFEAIGDNNPDRYKQLYLVLNSPKVDLSEEGIKVKAEQYAATAVDYGDPQWPVAMGYEQCAQHLREAK